MFFKLVRMQQGLDSATHIYEKLSSSELDSEHSLTRDLKCGKDAQEGLWGSLCESASMGKNSQLLLYTIKHSFQYTFPLEDFKIK